jgi:hypothetical protein
MVAAALAPAKAGTIINLDMDAETAAQHVRRIQEHLEQAENHVSAARALLWELRERGGYKALGYKSWRACVLEEFERCGSMLYKELAVAQVEMDLNLSPIGTIPERVLRPLANKGYSAETRQVLWNVCQDLVGAGGRVTTGVVEAVVEGLQEMLTSEATQDAEGQQTPITTRMQADLLARVREKKIAHKEHIRRMDNERTYILGGLPIMKATCGAVGSPGVAEIKFSLENNLQLETLIAAVRSGQPIYVSLWTEQPKTPSN